MAPDEQTDSFRLPARLDLRPGSLNRTMWSLALPAILENLMFTTVFFSDMMIVGWLRDENSLAATTLAGLLMFFINAPFYALSVAAASLVSRSWGQCNYRLARSNAASAMLLSVVLSGMLLAVFWPISGNVIRLLGGSREVVGLGTAYLRILLISGILGLPMVVSNGIIRAKGDARTPMSITIFMNIVNIAVSVVLAFGVGGFPRMGLSGVAWGTVIARSSGGVISLLVQMLPRTGIGLTASDFYSIDGRIFLRLWYLAFPAMLDRVLHTASSLVFIRIVAILGTSALAAHNIAIHVESLAFMPALGVGAATATIVGQAIGAGRSVIAELAIKRALLWCGMFMLLLGILFVIFAPSAVVVFGATPDVLKLAGIALQVAAIELPFLAFYIILSASLRGAGDTSSPLYVTIVCLFVFRLGAVYLLAIVFGWGIAGVWLATAMDWAARSAGLWWFFVKGPWKLIHKREISRYESLVSMPAE